METQQVFFGKLKPPVRPAYAVIERHKIAVLKTGAWHEELAVLLIRKNDWHTDILLEQKTEYGASRLIREGFDIRIPDKVSDWTPAKPSNTRKNPKRAILEEVI